MGIFSLLLGLICAQCCCRNTAHTPRSRNKLMDLEMDWQTVSPAPTHCSAHKKHHTQNRHTPVDDFWDTHLFAADGRWEWVSFGSIPDRSQCFFLIGAWGLFSSAVEVQGIFTLANGEIAFQTLVPFLNIFAFPIGFLSIWETLRNPEPLRCHCPLGLQDLYTDQLPP